MQPSGSGDRLGKRSGFGTAGQGRKVGAGFLDAAQSVASHYGVTVVVEADAVPTQTVSPDFSGTDPTVPLTALANTGNLKVQALQNNAYYLYGPSQAN